MIDAFLEFADEVKELQRRKDELESINHSLRVKINGLVRLLKENNIPVDTAEIPSQWTHPLKDYIAQVKNARESCGYSHNTWIWNCLAALEDDLKALQKVQEDEV